MGRKRRFVTANGNVATGILFWNLLNEYLHSRTEEKSLDTDKQKMMRVSHLVPETDKNSISGILKTGNYGFAAELENIDTGRMTMRGIHDCQLIPLFFRFDFKKGKDAGILLLQRYGIYGAKAALEDDLNAFFTEKNNGRHEVVFAADCRSGSHRKNVYWTVERNPTHLA